MSDTSITPSPKWDARLQKWLRDSVLWISKNQEKSWAMFGSAIAIVAVILLMIRNRAEFNEQAWNELGTIQGQQFQGKTVEALKALTDWETKYASTAAQSYAQFMKANLLVGTTDYTGASTIYNNLSLSAEPELLKPLALAGMINADELAGRFPEAKVAAQTFIDRYPDHFMASAVMMQQARLAELTKDNAAALALYDRMMLLNAQNPWIDLITRRQAFLKSSQSSAGK